MSENDGAKDHKDRDQREEEFLFSLKRKSDIHVSPFKVQMNCVSPLIITTKGTYSLVIKRFFLFLLDFFFSTRFGKMLLTLFRALYFANSIPKTR